MNEVFKIKEKRKIVVSSKKWLEKIFVVAKI